jgi:hypothetical protein
MKKFILANPKVFGTILAVYTILGGVVGLLLIYSLINEETTLGNYIVIVPIAILYLISVFAGVFYFWKQQRQRFYFLTKLILCFQVLQIVVKGFAYTFYYGPYLAIGFDGEPNFQLKFESLTLNFFVHFGDTETQSFMVNLVPIILLIILRWLERNPYTPAMEIPDHFLQEETKTDA